MKNNKAGIFITVVFLLTSLAFIYNYFTKDTHAMIFWGVLALINARSLDNLNVKKDE